MVKLATLEGEKIKLFSQSGRFYEGIVGDYIYPEDNAPEEIEAIVLDNTVRDDGYEFEFPVEFTAPEIKSIEIIK